MRTLLAVPLLLAGCAAPESSDNAGAAAGGKTAPGVVGDNAGPGAASGEGPGAGGGCPAAGVRMWFGDTSAAMGLRSSGLILENCGTAPLRVEGYPEITPLDEEMAELDVEVLRGVQEITGALPHLDAPPRPVELDPGDQAAAAVVWRNTYDDTRNLPVTVHCFRAGTRLVTPDSPLDLGSTGRVGVSPWQPVESRPAPAPPDPRAPADPYPSPNRHPDPGRSPEPDPLPLL
ncbi:DUF4232 domain-containing protein [Actinoplanes sp. DH11]|uniref:DUF4232 domain-containing protein n=1 Tax=Actinoplanes sp. DH11 TaxID=2857011 RepID=UPI001E2F3C7F|nr:DUF4232 domain-containing protein [Actinoplanes sp. DH11]